MRRCILLSAAAVLATAPSTVSAAGAPASPGDTPNGKAMQFASPLQSFTIFDKSSKSSSTAISSSRAKFLPRFRAGLAAERRAREEETRRRLYEDEDEEDFDEGGDWAEMSAAAEERRTKAFERKIEGAYDGATARFDRADLARQSKLASSRAMAGGGDGEGGYQFVGVVGGGEEKKSVVWYARKKPRGSKWSARLVHVNRDAALRDIFAKGKADVVGRYVNEGIPEPVLEAAEDGGMEVDGGNKLKPVVRAQYSLRERSWRTLWNFSPKRLLTTSSGSFWRERRLAPGLYTDGASVYETQYRFRDGRNGLKTVAKLEDFLGNSGGTMSTEQKLNLAERLRTETPDLVVEK